MFNIGDVVIGKPFNGYNATDDKCILEVTLIDAANDTFSGKCIAHKTLKGVAGKTFDDLRAKAFELATLEAINAVKGIKPKKEKPELTIKLGNIVIEYHTGMIESNLNKLKKLQQVVDNAQLTAFSEIRKQYKDQKSIMDFQDSVDLSCFEELIGQKARKKALEGLIDFFKEFQFEPNFRFVNTLCFKLSDGTDKGTEYIRNYFNLTDSPYKDAIVDKMKSEEFKGIMTILGIVAPSKRINTRLKVYYGSQGAGKTYRACEESDGRCIVCNNSMLPDDLMQDFVFTDGKPGFNKSTMRECMEKGLPLTLDEMNLLPFETVRFLQGILDGKKEFIFKGQKIQIKDGFTIIGTMNLIVNGMAFGLPEPLVDRCSDIQKFVLKAEDLMAAL